MIKKTPKQQELFILKPIHDVLDISPELQKFMARKTEVKIQRIQKGNKDGG